MSTLEERAAQRRKHMAANLARSPEEAEAWDVELVEVPRSNQQSEAEELGFWQKAGPEGRFAALEAIRGNVATADDARFLKLVDGQQSQSSSLSNCRFRSHSV